MQAGGQPACRVRHPQPDAGRVDGWCLPRPPLLCFLWGSASGWIRFLAGSRARVAGPMWWCG